MFEVTVAAGVIPECSDLGVHPFCRIGDAMREVGRVFSRWRSISLVASTIGGI